MNITDTTTVTSGVVESYKRIAHMRGTPYLVHGLWGQLPQAKSLPGKHGRQAHFRMYDELTGGGIIPEGVTPQADTPQHTDVTSTVYDIGDHIIYSDVVDYSNADPLLVEFSEMLGERVYELLDSFIRDNISGGTSVYHANAVATRLLTADGPSTSDLDAVKTLLKTNKARFIKKMINATTGISTVPIRSCFMGICHTDKEDAFEALTGFIPVEKYAAQQNTHESEIGSYKHIRFVGTQNAKVFEEEGAAGIDVYSTLIFGSDAYGVLPVEGRSLQTIIKALGSSGVEDPYNQRGSIALKKTMTALIIKQNWIIRYEHA